MINAKTAKVMTKKAQEKIFEDALNRRDILIEEVMKDLENLIINSSEKGLNYCYYQFESDFKPSLEKIILIKTKPLIDEFEDAGYKIILSQIIKNSSTLYLCLYWGESLKEYSELLTNRKYMSEDGVLYYTIDFSDLKA